MLTQQMLLLFLQPDAQLEALSDELDKSLVLVLLAGLNRFEVSCVLNTCAPQFNRHFLGYHAYVKQAFLHVDQLVDPHKYFLLHDPLEVSLDVNLQRSSRRRYLTRDDSEGENEL